MVAMAEHAAGPLVSNILVVVLKCVSTIVPRWSPGREATAACVNVELKRLVITILDDLCLRRQDCPYKNMGSS
jgi:hypothetical protein